MKLFLLFQPVFSVWAEEGHPTATEALDPFSGGADPLTTIVLVLLLIVIVWLLLRSQVSQVDTSDLDHDGHGHDAHGHDDHGHAEPVAPAASAGPDDLKVIEGIGPKVQTALNAAGITTYAGLAGTAVDKLQEILDAAGYQYMKPASWPEQAALAAAGDWDALKKLQDELTAGR